MHKNYIKNFSAIATTQNRKIALEIIESGLDAISTKHVVESFISVKENILEIKGEKFDLEKFKTVKIIGFGKSSSEAALVLENILGSKIKEGIVIDVTKIDCKYIETFVGTHPKPSLANAVVGEKIYKMLKHSTEEDLFIVLVSGGGSALLCCGEQEYEQGSKLYDAFLGSGKTINEINTVRKHLSLFKGGGLVKIAYPATVIGLIFSDVPGDIFEDVASGPTYKDKTTINDAEKIIKENNLGEFELIETPKEDKFFEKVHNFVLVSNKTAVLAMAEKAKEFGLDSNIISTDLYKETNEALDKIFSSKKEGSVILAAGESRVIVNKESGRGGRNLHMGLSLIEKGIIDDDSVFVALASDGMDNSDVAGALIDKETLKSMKDENLKVKDYLDRFDSYTFFKKAGGMIVTGPTGSNVSDLMILLTKK